MRRDDERDSDALQVGTEASVAVRNEAGTTLRVSFWKAATIEARVEKAKELTDPNGLAALLEGRAEERREKDRDDRRQSLAQLGEIVRDQQREREREQWLQTTHSFAGQSLTGEQWRGIADELKSDSPGRRWLLDYLMLRGQTQDEAIRMANDMQLASSGMSKPERDRTDDEKAAMQRIEANPEAAEAFEKYREAQEKGFPPQSADTAPRLHSERNEAVASGHDTLDDNFIAAPRLTEHHRAATAATAPLDVKLQPASTPAAPAPVANAGLDI